MGRVAWPLGRGDTHLVHGTRRVRNQTATANAESWFAAAMNAAAAGIPVVPAHYLMPTVGEGPTRCSCNQPSCLTPGRHLRDELSGEDVTTDPDWIARWWGADGQPWNLATVAGVGVDVVELSYKGEFNEIEAWLRRHAVEDGPIIELGNGWTRFLTTVSQTASKYAPLVDGWVGRPVHNAVVLLPPSQLPDGRKLRWLTGPVGTRLPDGERLYEVLAALPAPPALATWAERWKPETHTSPTETTSESTEFPLCP